MDERIAVTVMFDWADSLLWVGTPVSYEDAHITPELEADLSALESIMLNAVDQSEYIVLDPALRSSIDARGAELAERLAAELGRDFRVSFAPPRGTRSRFWSNRPPSSPLAAAALHAIHAAWVGAPTDIRVVGMTPDDGPFGTGIGYHSARDLGLSPDLTSDVNVWRDYFVRNLHAGSEIDVFSNEAITWFRDRGLELGERVSIEVGRRFEIKVGYFTDEFGRFRSEADAINPLAAARLRELCDADPVRYAEGQYKHPRKQVRWKSWPFGV